MDPQDIYAKTEKGLAEVTLRTYQLPQTMRSLLIMINGTTTAGAFLDRSPVLGDVAAMLAGLEQQGFIVKTGQLNSLPIKTAEIPQNKAPKIRQAGDGGLVDFGNMFITDENEK